jgi:DNA-binding MarR family transcriptional regulator
LIYNPDWKGNHLTQSPDLTTTLLDLASTLIRLSLHDFSRFARSNGLSLAQMNVLLHLYYRGPIEVMSLCEMMQLSPAGASQMIERMVQQGVVQRAETPGDRRVRQVSLTEQGRRLVLDSLAERKAWVEKLVADFSPEETLRIAETLSALNERTRELEIPVS